VPSCPNCTTAAPDGFRCPTPAQHVSCTRCHLQIPRRADPPVPTRCQFCGTTLCDAYRRYLNSETDVMSANGCRTTLAGAGAGWLRPLNDSPLCEVPAGFGRIGVSENRGTF
jgi:hypothetical protein